MAASILAETEDLRVCYGRVEALHGLSVRIHEGQIVTVVGANGAGKTTLLSALMGLLPHTGRIAFPRWPNAVLSVEERIRAGLCLVPESRDLFGTMPVEDNLRLGGFSRRRDRGYSAGQSLEEVFALFPRLKERRRQTANTLSGGERQMLALGRALMGKPKLLMLDEPSLGLAPLVTKEIITAVAGLRDHGVSILLIEQNARAALAVADHAYVMETGSIMLEGPAEAVARDPRVIDSYLGARRADPAPSNEDVALAAHPRLRTAGS
ncbi:ABC transporter ATP-binding protein [Azospirillum endophyticum]